MRTVYLCLVALVASAPAFTQTPVPPSPTLTAGPEFKGLQFDWEQVAGATSYELEYRANLAGSFVRLGNVLPASATSFRYRFPLHLFNWTHARYRLAACNSAGCSRSPEVSVSGLRRFSVGYFKAGASAANFRFGLDADISSDGFNMVSAAPGDSDSGAIYVFRRNSDGSWTQRARLLPQNSEFNTGVSSIRVAISADGNTVVAGLPQYSHTEGDQLNSGEVFVFRFNGTTWVRSRLFSGTRGSFGRWVDINDAGDILAVATGAIDRSVLIYRLTNGAWQPVRSIGQQFGPFCGEGVLSGDGSTLAETCATSDARSFVRVHTGPNWTQERALWLQIFFPPPPEGYGNAALGIDTTGDTIAAQVYVPDIPEPVNGPSVVSVFKRTAGVYSQVAELRPGDWRALENRSFFGLTIAVSGDGRTIAVGDALDNGLGTGPRAAPLTAGEAPTGAVYVYRVYPQTGRWILSSVVKPNYKPPEDHRLFGRTPVALNGNGQTLIVSDGGEASDAQGIGGDWSDDDAPDSGAVWLY